MEGSGGVSEGVRVEGKEGKKGEKKERGGRGG